MARMKAKRPADVNGRPPAKRPKWRKVSIDQPTLLRLDALNKSAANIDIGLRAIENELKAQRPPAKSDVIDSLRTELAYMRQTINSDVRRAVDFHRAVVAAIAGLLAPDAQIDPAAYAQEVCNLADAVVREAKKRERS